MSHFHPPAAQEPHEARTWRDALRVLALVALLIASLCVIVSFLLLPVVPA